LNLTWFDLAGFVGVLLIVIAYLLLQLGKLPSSAPAFSLLNAIGAFLVMFSLVFDFNLAAFLMEAFWFLISLFGFLRIVFSQSATG
jgi:paired small multidrug resistance pump